jgi:hypothetical protein
MLFYTSTGEDFLRETYEAIASRYKNFKPAYRLQHRDGVPALSSLLRKKCAAQKRRKHYNQNFLELQEKFNLANYGAGCIINFKNSLKWES